MGVFLCVLHKYHNREREEEPRIGFSLIFPVTSMKNSTRKPLYTSA